MRGYFAQVRRAGLDIGLSAGKLTKAMVEVLSQLPREATPAKDVVASTPTGSVSTARSCVGLPAGRNDPERSSRPPVSASSRPWRHEQE